MIKKLFWLPAILSLACLVFVTDSGFARPGGGGGSGRGGGGRGGRGGSGGGRGGYGGGGYGRGGYGYGGFGLGLGLGYGFGYGGLGYGGYPYYGGGYSDGGNSYNSYYPPTTSDPSAAPAYANQQPATPPTDAHIEVIVPDAQAKVWFDGSLTQQTGTQRIFTTPSLGTTGVYRYTLRASWSQNGQPVTQDRTIAVTPGRTTLVDFSQPVRENVPAPNPGGK